MSYCTLQITLIWPAPASKDYLPQFEPFCSSIEHNVVDKTSVCSTEVLAYHIRLDGPQTHTSCSYAFLFRCLIEMTFTICCWICRWIADDLGIPSFARLSELTIVPVNDFDKRFSVWTIDSQLSPGCGGPPLPEEIIL